MDNLGFVSSVFTTVITSSESFSIVTLTILTVASDSALGSALGLGLGSEVGLGLGLAVLEEVVAVLVVTVVQVMEVDPVHVTRPGE